VDSAIPGGRATISGGGITQDSAYSLANVLKYGSLPLAFEISSVDTVSPTLGGEQLRAGLIAGAVGLLLVLIFCFLYYRGLGLVVISSLGVAFAATYACMVLLGTSVGFALNLAGIAGAIVAIGVTADSFVIYFARIRDEVGEGRTIRTAVETAWRRARQTLLIADAVSLLSALILFMLAIGSVRGFAFTLGLTTLIDVAVVFFFTKPLVTLLARTKFFGNGHKLSGLDATHLGIDHLPGGRSSVRPTVRNAVGGGEA
jgi:preprotein translocase subunit SecD